ncbi:DNA replication ATP-dependent helicase/nuclease DNA2 [Lucilia sericata]|uniref:DNA replication ATP-dependent helicase/nuclease DNA2 n=1 Tax=Lucilia sericata TaxID=13632 RepID=UPI0018A80A5A|nr:DNA replication ATP-dependent helicase/nuclease DNA2 [Lucilia sericata]
MNTAKRLISPFKEHNESAAKKIKVQMSEDFKAETIDEKSVDKEENYDFLFDEEDDFDLSAFETAEKDVVKEKLDLSKWKRCLVKEVERDKKTFALVLKVSGKNGREMGDAEQEAEAKCHLQGPWCHTRISVEDVVSLLGEWDDSLQAYKVDKDQGFCVINPDTLISGTSVVGSLFCRRKAVLQDRFRGIDANNKVMVIGSLVHELLQIVLEKDLKELKDIEKLAHDLLNSQETAFMLYGSQLTREDTTMEVLQFVRSIHQFMQQYVDEKLSSSFPLQKESFQGRITEIQDIEENLWIPQLGLKGKIDVSVKIHPRRQKGQLANFLKQQEKVVPLELKTGRASFSMEHKGQLILYQMMLSALGKPTESGLLLYLRENLMREILGSRNEQRDLIGLRNDLSHYLSNFPDFATQPADLALPEEKFIQPFELPEPISHPTACAQCAYATICCSFAKTDSSLELRASHPLNKVSSDSISHLTAKDYEYFMKWCHLLMMEEQEARKSNYLRALWCQTPENRQEMGRAICNLKISQQPIEKEESRYKHTFVLESNNSNGSAEDGNVEDGDILDLTLSGFSVGEYVIVSTPQRLAIAAGFVLDLSPTSITVSLERNLLQNYKQQTFIIDKHDSHSGNVFNFTNLGLLLDNTERSSLLRQIIIEKQPPSYHKVLPKIIATEGAEILKQLNVVQRAAVLKALTTQSFMLIKGLPGTGKTQTLVAIVRLLHLMGKSVLITSHTHSAVDNLLLRLKDHQLPFLRLGSSARVNAQLKNHSETILTANCKTEAELSKLYDSYQIVGVTCLGSSHAIFLHRRFDFCIVDEATQVMQPTVLRPLFFSQRFILVGDPDQLPPLIRSPLARQKGADESLFQRLDCTEATSVLTLQYRMNKTITKLANELTYQGSLQCGSNEVKSAIMYKPINQTFVKEKWLQRVLQTHVDQSVFLLDTLDCSERSYNFAKTKHSATCSLIETTFNEEQLPGELLNKSPTKTSKRLSKYTNYCEAALVFRVVTALLNCQYDPQRIGVVAPYRAQVELLKKLVLQHHEYYEKSSKENKSTLDFSSVEVNTVDQYQGRDKDIIIYSCSRTGSSANKNMERNRDAEILEDKRRLTVAITRSKHKLIIVGDAACIQQYTPFQTLLQHIPGFCKLKLEDDKLGFQWSAVMEDLSRVINAT